MINKHYILAIIIFLGYVIPGIARMDTINIAEVSVSYNKLGFKNMELDTSILKENQGTELGDLLSRYSHVFVKNYGTGQSSTPSFRGTGANHTKVSWNGINLTNRMLGQTDFSTFSSYITDKVIIHQGSGSLEEFSDAIGGTINLYNEPDWEQKFDLKALQHIGSFNTTNSFITAAIGNDQLRNRTRVYYKNSENDYEYLNTKFSREDKLEKRKYADYDYGGIMNETYWRFRDNSFLSAKIWGQFYNRNLPGPISADKSYPNENQEDKNFRSVLEWKQYSRKNYYEVKSAYLYDFIEYNHNNLNINSVSHIHSWLNKFHHKRNLKHGFAMKYGGSVDYNQVNTNNYTNTKDRITYTLYHSVTKEFKDRLKLKVLLREEVINHEFSPLIFNAGSEWYFLSDQNLTIKGNISRNFNYPSFNDLYWNPGGNPDLKPEDGISAETGVAFSESNDKKSAGFTLEVISFYSNINNWITWTPGAGSIWSPENLNEVISRGVETSLKANLALYNIQWLIHGNYAYTLSTDVSSGQPYQLAYVPKNKFNSSLSVSYQKISFHYNFHFVGERFVDKHHTEAPLSHYAVSDLSVGYKYPFSNFVLGLKMKVKNLLDENYEVIEYQPLPGRNYQMSISVDF